MSFNYVKPIDWPYFLMFIFYYPNTASLTAFCENSSFKFDIQYTG